MTAWSVHATFDSMRTAGEIPDAMLRLALAEGLGPLLLTRCLARFGSAEAVCDAGSEKLETVQGIGAATARKIAGSIRAADVDGEREEIERAGAGVIMRGDNDYPRLLAEIDDPPIMLYVRGTLEIESALSLAVVGSRRCTAYGREQADRLAGLLSDRGLTIVSGGARGIDTAAHAGATRSDGRTIAVLGCGLSRVYPPENRALFDELVGVGGALVSELPMRFPPLAQNFLPRNRIIAGLSLGVLVVEAALRSGALSTARQAADMGRAVFAVPGRIDSATSVGCHKLIQQGAAALVTGPADIVRGLEEATLPLLGAALAAGGDEAAEVGELNTDASHGADESALAATPPRRTKATPFAPGDMSPEQRLLYTALTEAKSLHALLEETGLSADQALTALTMLEVRAIIQRQGSLFRRT
jgi:DNA processing protein